jgi:putative membrane protein
MEVRHSPFYGETKSRQDPSAKGVTTVMGPWGWIWMLVWVAALLVMVWWIVRGSGGGPGTEDALTILRARFARGEISKEEFERARDVLLVDPKELKP